MKSVLYTKYNKLRREEFRISTMICEDSGRRYVEKRALTPKAEQQIKYIYENSLSIGKAYRQLKILIPEYKKDAVIFEYLNGINLERSFMEYLDNFTELIGHIKDGLNVITDIHDEYRTDFFVTDKYKEVFGEAAYAEAIPATTWTNIDVLFDNIIIKDGQYICLDCEWVFDFPTPVKFVEYRCLFYFYQKYEAYIKRWADLNTFLKCFDIDDDEKNIFMNMERNFQMYVTGKDFDNDYVYKYEKPCQTLDEAYMDRNRAETRIQSLEDENLRLNRMLNDYQKRLDECQQQLDGKYEHVKHLENIVVEKSRSEAGLLHELNLKEQHVQNLTAYIKSFQNSSWYKLKNKSDTIKNKLHRSKE